MWRRGLDRETRANAVIQRQQEVMLCLHIGEGDAHAEPKCQSLYHRCCFSALHEASPSRFAISAAPMHVRVRRLDPITSLEKP